MTNHPTAVLEERLGARPDVSNEDIILSYCTLLERELPFRRSRGLEVAPLKVYYKKLLDEEGRLIPVGVFGYCRRLVPVINELRNADPPLKILDAGCGYGTESLLFSLLGHKVTGVELVPERAELARSRIDYFASVCPFRFHISFHNANILRFLQNSDDFSLIWAMEAISHIFPPESFFRMAYGKLRKGGKLIISDPNTLNPVAWLRAVRIRGSLRHSPHRRFKDPETGEPVNYGREKIFSIFSIKDRLRQFGFRIERMEISGFMGSSFLPSRWLHSPKIYRLLIGQQKTLSGLPIFRWFGSTFTVVAVKDE